MELPPPNPQQSYLPSPTTRHWYYQFQPPFDDGTEGQSLLTHTNDQMVQLMRNDWNEYNEAHPIDWENLHVCTVRHGLVGPGAPGHRVFESNYVLDCTCGFSLGVSGSVSSAQNRRAEHVRTGR